ncbi:MAG: radical SAM family heme chaperone HemW [Chitinophagaceae bacterium]
MAGIYIHIPFCRKACHYCNFHFSTSLQLQSEMVGSILEEIALRRSYLGGDRVETIYFGGGTPSLLSPEELKAILGKLGQTFEIAADAEITFEANPDDITPAKLDDWRAAGINRLSIGVQSFFDEDLRWMNRAHGAAQSLQCLQDAEAAGFYNLNIDLIYGGPGMTDEKWAYNVQQAIEQNIPHLSCYALTVEPATALDKMIKKHQVDDVDPERQASQFLYLSETLSLAGYEHYEISNFSKPGMRSRHNTSYWQGKHYLGIGASAHSFNGVSRQWNIANNVQYIKSITGGLVPFEIEMLTLAQQKNEYIMTALRTMEGISLTQVRDWFGEEEVERIVEIASSFVYDGRLLIKNDCMVLTMSGRLFADGIASDLFV